MKPILKAYKIRIYPNRTQIKQIETTFGAVRNVYNYFVNLTKERLDLGEYKLNYNTESSVLTLLKLERDWLTLADKFTLQNAIKDQDRAFANLFEKRAKFPRFRSKKDNYQTYRTNLTNGNIAIIDNKLKLPKLGFIKFAKSQEIIGKILNVTVLRSNGKYYASIACEVQYESKSMPTAQTVDIDLGLKSFAVMRTNTGETITVDNPKWLEKSLKNLKCKQRALSKKQHPRFRGDTTEKSNSYLKLQKTVSKINTRVANQRKDFLHKLSSKIVSENQAIGIEDLAVKNLVRNHKLSRHIAQSGWSMFRAMLEYKSSWSNKKVVVHDRFYPSSKLCECGVKNSELKLSDRLWVCKSCLRINSRDELAANNLVPVECLGEFTPREYAPTGTEGLSNV